MGTGTIEKNIERARPPWFTGNLIYNTRDCWEEKADRKCKKSICHCKMIPSLVDAAHGAVRRGQIGFTQGPKCMGGFISGCDDVTGDLLRESILIWFPA